MFSEVRILEVNNDSTVLVGCSTKACEGCKAQMFCNNKDENSFLAKNVKNLELQKGDRVKVFLPPAKTITSTLLVFALPLVLFPMGYLAFKVFFEFSELVNALAGIGAMALAFGIASIISVRKRYELMPEVVEIMTGEEQ